MGDLWRAQKERGDLWRAQKEKGDLVVSQPVGGILSGDPRTTWVAIHLSGLPGIMRRAA